MTPAVASLTRRARARLAAEAGFGLVEVMVSAALLVVVLIALSAGIDGPSEVAARNQQRAVAATLAQQDQDQMRAMRTVDLASYNPAPRQVNVGGVNYTVTSRGSWYRDASGSLSCVNNSAVVQYIDITSTVTWPAMRGPAVTEESLVAPKNGAFNLIAQIVDEKGNPVSGLPITTSQTASATRITNSFGCAAFGDMPVGPYTLSFSKQGWVDPDGVTNVALGATVAAGTTTTVSHNYAAGATIAVSFDTKVNGVVQAASGRSVTVANSGLSTGTRVFPTTGPGAPVTTITTPLLYPFTTGYGVYAGNCASNNPGASNTPTVQTPYGSNQSVTVREPAINILVKKSGAALKNANVKVAVSGATGCTGAVETYVPQLTDAGGALPSPAFPYGKYSICADDGLKHVTKTVTNTNPNGTTLPVPSGQTFDITNNGTKGKCP